MIFEMSTQTLKLLMKTEFLIQKHIGCELDFNSDNLLRDFFELCGLCQDRRIALQADQIWASLIKKNQGLEKSKELNQYRSRMKVGMTKVVYAA